MSRDLLRMSGRAIDATPAMDAILDGLLESNRKQFDSEGQHGSGGWTRPSDDWIAEKSRRGLDSRTEQATLALRKSLTERGGNNIAVTTRDGVKLSTTVPYAKYSKKRGNILSQPTQQERRQWVKLVQAWVVSADRSGGILGDVL